MSNKAAWLTEAKARHLKVGDAEYYKPAADEVLIKNFALAVNPVEWMVQVWHYSDLFMFEYKR